MSPSARAHLETGLRAHRAGDLDAALGAYAAALAEDPGNPDASHLLGVVLAETGRPEEALPHLERAAKGYRQQPEVVANLAQAYLATGRHDDAANAFRKAARLAPQNPQYSVGLAAALGSAGKLDEAEALLTRTCSRFPKAALAWLNLGHVKRDKGQTDEALSAYEKAAVIEPTLAAAHNSIGRMHHVALRFDRAEAAFRRCLAVAPGDLAGLFNLASVTIDRGDLIEAERVSRELVARAPQLADAHTLLAAALGQQGKLWQAREAYARAAELAPHDAKVQENYATALLESGCAAEGLRLLTHMLARGTASQGAQQVLGTWLLAHGQLADGWRDYRERPTALRLREKYAALPVVSSLPADLEGRHVCVLREQGIGDEVFLLRYAELLAARGARITYRGSPKVVPLLRRLTYLEAITDDLTPPPRADAYVLLGDLPALLHAHDASAVVQATTQPCVVRDFERAIRLYWPEVPPTIALAPAPEKRLEVERRLALAGPPPYIGLTWRAGTKPDEQKADWVLHKEVRLEALASALKGARGTLIALQRNPGAGEIEALSRLLGRELHDLTSLNDDLEGMLGVLAVIDDYVGVSNTNMHLRAAAGKAARVLVPAPAEWRWMQLGAASPWFPGFTIYRQSLDGDWTPAFERLEGDLRAA